MQFWCGITVYSDQDPFVNCYRGSNMKLTCFPRSESEHLPPPDLTTSPVPPQPIGMFSFLVDGTKPMPIYKSNGSIGKALTLIRTCPMGVSGVLISTHLRLNSGDGFSTMSVFIFSGIISYI